MTLKTLKLIAILLAAAHFAIVAVHGAAHRQLSIDLSTWQSAFVLIVIVALPVAAAALIVKWPRNGSLLLAASMAAAFLFGVYFHFVAESADHVSRAVQLEPRSWANAFSWSAALLAVVELAAAIAATALYAKTSARKQ